MNHRQRLIITAIMTLLTVITSTRAVHAALPAISTPTGLSIVEIKMTGDEFIVLQNNTGQMITNLSNYWLTVYNSTNPLTASVSSSTQQLPTIALGVGQTLQLSADAMPTCGAAVAGKLSVSLTDAGGYLQISQLSMSSAGAITHTPSDVVSWSSGASGVIQNVPSSTKNPRVAYYRYSTGSGFAWQQAELDTSKNCQLNIVVAGGQEPSSAITPLTLAATSPPATILGTVTAGDGAAIAQIPAADIGLDAPQLSEVLPNPIGTGNDSTDEFIELYNPNGKPFDLTGFILQTGTTTTKQYVFPADTKLEPASFKAFFAEETKLSLSNTAGQVALFDPLGNPISVASAYSKAKDGYSWSQAKGQWFWSTRITPGVANVIVQPAVKQTKGKTSSKVKTKSLTSGTASHPRGVKEVASTSGFFDNIEQKAPVHVWILALVIGGALLYGAYEYRKDIANRLHQLRTKLSASRANWQSAQRGRSD